MEGKACSFRKCHLTFCHQLILPNFRGTITPNTPTHLSALFLSEEDERWSRQTKILKLHLPRFQGGKH